MQQRGTVRPDGSGAPQSAAMTDGRQTRGQKLNDSVKTLGFYPKETKPTSDEDKGESQLAKQLRKARARQFFTPAELIELNELQRASVHPRDTRGQELIDAVKALGF